MDSNRIALDVERITDYSIPLTILSDETIASEIHEDGSILTVPDIVSEYWLSVHFENYIIGCYRLHPMGAVTWQIHARILPRYRQVFAVRSTKAVFKWAVNNIPDLSLIMCFVPQIHTNVAMHCKQVGMHQAGCLEQSYIKNKSLMDQDLFSITKEKINQNGGTSCPQQQ